MSLFVSKESERNTCIQKKKIKITMQEIRIKNKEKYEKLTETQI